MERIIRLEKITVDLIKIFNLEVGDVLYSIELENKNIGYGIIRKNLEIEVYILKQYQSNGYGTKLFKYLLNLLDKEITIKIRNDNVVMGRIIEKCNGIEVSRNNKDIIYIIPKIEK